METAMETTSKMDAGDDLPAFKLLFACPAGFSPSEVTPVINYPNPNNLCSHSFLHLSSMFHNLCTVNSRVLNSVCKYKVSVKFDQTYDRIPHPDISLENSIAEMWDMRVQQNPSLYNGLKFRYGGYTLGGGPDSSRKTNVCLHLGLTDYRTFVGTNLNPLWERFLVPSEDDWKRCQHTSNPLGNGAIVETLNKDVVVLQRSTNVGEFPGHFVFPGGHPEPKEVGITSHHTNGELSCQMVNKQVSQEMFDSIIREVVEEIGVPAANLDQPVFIGISQRVLNVRPTAFFFIKCSLESKEIHQLYSGAEDGYESTQLYTMPMSDLGGIASKMPGCHQGGFALYKLMVVDAATAS